MTQEITEFCVADASAWRAWLDANEDASDGVWLVLAGQVRGSLLPIRFV